MINLKKHITEVVTSFKSATDGPQKYETDTFGVITVFIAIVGAMLMSIPITSAVINFELSWAHIRLASFGLFLLHFPYFYNKIKKQGEKNE